MKRNIETTGDGSTTLRVEQWDEPYHSVHGAIQESLHVFIENGLKMCRRDHLRILELGFGTGLNALLSMREVESSEKVAHYTALEAYPLSITEVKGMNYPDQLGEKRLREPYTHMNACAWEEDVCISPSFTLRKLEIDFRNYHARNQFDLVYFDAFGPRVQPELWTNEMFNGMYAAMDSKGILVTYCAKGSVRRAMQDSGFYVERLKGPPGKREMLRATK